MTLTDTLTKLRRFLRDPDGDIWTDADLLVYWNDAQLDVAQKTLVLARVEAHHYPPEYDYAYTHDWEQAYIGGDSYCPFEVSQTRAGLSFTHVWESAYYLDSVTTTQSNYRITHPWEGAYVTPDRFIPVKLHEQLDRMLFCAYDQEQITPASRREIAAANPYYQTQTGAPVNYWRIDDYTNQMVLYPQPAMVIRNYSYTEVLDDPATYPNPVTTSSEEWLDATDTGLIIDVINIGDSLFTVYMALPTDISAWTDETALPPWFLKAIECGALERAYGADSDGFIPSLRDYWKIRKDLQIKLIAKYKVLRLTDRDFVMGSFPKPARSRRGRLPAGYPAV